MSVFGSLFTAVSGLSSQSDSISMISNNIANVSTVGYKRTDAAFSSLVTTSGRSTAYSSGSVRSIQNARVDQQGILQQSTSGTDIAISGNGFFIVKPSITDALAETLYTRAGSFSEDASGALRNASGFFLMGWPLDQNGALPASQADLTSLVPVDVAFLGGLTQPTTSASMAVNLKAGEAQTTFPVSAGFTPDFTRAVKVFDSLGGGHELTVNFKKMTSPTATGIGSVDLHGIVGNFSDNAPFSGTDSFTIQTTGMASAATITLDGTMNDMLAEINALQDSTTLQPVVRASLDSVTGKLVLKAVQPGETIKLVDGSGTPLALANKLGMDGSITYVPATSTTVTGSVDVSAYNGGGTKTFTIQVGSGAATPISVAASEDINDILTSLNAVADLNASLDSDGQLVLKALNSGDTITLTDGGGGNACLADFGLAAGVESPDGTLNMLTATSSTPNTEGWWTVEFEDDKGAIISSGAVNFGGSGKINGTLDTDDKMLVSLDNIDWANGSDAQSVNFDISGFNQFSGEYNVISSTQNGAELGLRTGVSIDKDGYVTAQFSNGQSSRIFKLAIATFANANGLSEITGNVFRESNTSGSFNLREPGKGSAGTIAAGALEASNVDLADEFSKMIVTQRAYSANTKVISTADQMTQELLQLR